MARSRPAPRAAALAAARRRRSLDGRARQHATRARSRATGWRSTTRRGLRVVVEPAVPERWYWPVRDGRPQKLERAQFVNELIREIRETARRVRPHAATARARPLPPAGLLHGDDVRPDPRARGGRRRPRGARLLRRGWSASPTSSTRSARIAPTRTRSRSASTPATATTRPRTSGPGPRSASTGCATATSGYGPRRRPHERPRGPGRRGAGRPAVPAPPAAPAIGRRAALDRCSPASCSRRSPCGCGTSTTGSRSRSTPTRPSTSCPGGRDVPRRPRPRLLREPVRAHLSAVRGLRPLPRVPFGGGAISPAASRPTPRRRS